MECLLVAARRAADTLGRVSRQCLWSGAALLLSSMPGQVSAYDNSRSPPFQPATTGRDFGNVSVHPDGEHWLVTESVEKNKGVVNSIVWLYHLPTRTQKRYQLSDAYQYEFARFSPSGRHIVMTRYPKPAIAGEPAFRASIAQGEIVMMNTDGTDFRVLPIPKGKIFLPVMSPDERRIAYWLSTKDRAPGERTLITNFEVHEFDRDKEITRRFSEYFSFYEFRSLAYIADDTIMMGAYGLMQGKSNHPNPNNLFASQIFLSKRDSKEVIHSFMTFRNANTPASDSIGNTYFGTEVEKIGIAVARQSSNGKVSVWRVPNNLSRINDICAEPGGRYLAIVYHLQTTNQYREKNKNLKSLAIFDLKKEIWVDVAPPVLQTADSIRIIEQKDSSQGKLVSSR